MRIEVRVERDEHEAAVTIECDQSIRTEHAIATAARAIHQLESSAAST